MSERWFDHRISVRSERVKALQVWGFNERQARFLVVEASPGRDDNGLLKFSDGAFVWQHSEEGWTDIVEKLGAMGTRAGHQYLDGPRDDVQLMASFGEYGDEWWNRHEN